MKIGDLVKSKDLTVEVLACGSGRYDKAMVYSLEPFELISQEGDMIWGDVNPDHFEVIGEADSKTLANCVRRLLNDLKEIEL